MSVSRRTDKWPSQHPLGTGTPAGKTFVAGRAGGARWQVMLANVTRVTWRRSLYLAHGEGPSFFFSNTPLLSMEGTLDLSSLEKTLGVVPMASKSYLKPFFPLPPTNLFIEIAWERGRSPKTPDMVLYSLQQLLITLACTQAQKHQSKNGTSRTATIDVQNLICSVKCLCNKCP